MTYKNRYLEKAYRHEALYVFKELLKLSKTNIFEEMSLFPKQADHRYESTSQEFVYLFDPVSDRTHKLDSTLKAQFERAFDADFSDVRIHTGSYADELTRDS